MKFQADPTWTPIQLDLHRERWELLVEMNKCYSSDPERYKVIAPRYHEITKILGDEDYNS